MLHGDVQYDRHISSHQSGQQHDEWRRMYCRSSLLWLLPPLAPVTHLRWMRCVEVMTDWLEQETTLYLGIVFLEKSNIACAWVCTWTYTCAWVSINLTFCYSLHMHGHAQPPPAWPKKMAKTTATKKTHQNIRMKSTWRQNVVPGFSWSYFFPDLACKMNGHTNNTPSSWGRSGQLLHKLHEKNLQCTKIKPTINTARQITLQHVSHLAQQTLYLVCLTFFWFNNSFTQSSLLPCDTISSHFNKFHIRPIRALWRRSSLEDACFEGVVFVGRTSLELGCSPRRSALAVALSV